LGRFRKPVLNVTTDHFKAPSNTALLGHTFRMLKISSAEINADTVNGLIRLKHTHEKFSPPAAYVNNGTSCVSSEKRDKFSRSFV
jgi:hypothetical protein